MLADDEHDRRAVAAVHPEGWVNPTATQRYNLVVIGAGTAGLVAAAATAGLGGKVALIEGSLMGGDCLNVGCVPSKALLSSAHRAARSHAPASNADFPAAMQRMRRLRAEIAPVDGAARFAELGVDVFFGHGRFTGADTVSVAGQELRFARAVIATGARARVPEISGLSEAGYLTNDTFFDLQTLPHRLTVIGGGPIGCELSQAMARLGAKVTLVDSGPRILANDDPDAAAVVLAALKQDGVTVHTGANVSSVDTDRTVLAAVDGQNLRIASDAILVATGRIANTEELGLDAVGVQTESGGRIAVDDRLRTSNRRIYAAGDCCSSYQFTHAADAMARIVVRNALFFGREKLSNQVIPWATYTHPEVAHVGLTAEMAARNNVEVTTYEQPLAHVDRSIVDERTQGFVRIHVAKGTDTIVGATIVADRAGDLIAEICLAMKSGLGLSAIAKVVHPYPSTALAIRQVADQYSRTRLTPFVARLFRWILRWRRA